MSNRPIFCNNTTIFFSIFDTCCFQREVNWTDDFLSTIETTTYVGTNIQLNFIEHKRVKNSYPNLKRALLLPKLPRRQKRCCCVVAAFCVYFGIEPFLKDTSGSPRGRSSSVKRVLNCSKKVLSPMKWSIIDMNKNQSNQTVLNRLIKPNGNHFFFCFIIININILIHDGMDSWLFYTCISWPWNKGSYEGKIRIFCLNWKIKFVANIKHISGCDIVNYRRVRFWHVQLRHGYSTDC